MSDLWCRVFTMSYMKNLLESTELIKPDTLMGNLIYHACPENAYYSEVWDCEVNVYRISLHCFEFLIHCIKSKNDYLIIQTEKVYN